ncbi:MAG: YfhO family protein [Gracilimonas sp.]|uniref:YfhO family protein n=1 Tax=Gracilimonas sp. TaxID=1974203 RepID=UPI00199E8C99|nr:YfhO family protein [Gracilimonas sp.]MBD3616864.1 YfhO family protein [Gracilimonas sp.]
MPDTNSASNQDFFSSLSETRQHIIALLILFLIPFFLFTATTIGGKEFQRHDITQWRASAESVIEYREIYDKEPLWVNNMFGGMPSFVVSTKVQVPHLDRIAPLFRNIYPAFQYWVLLSGTYFLLIIMGFRSLSSVFGSLMYGLTAYFPIIIVAGHTNKFAALTFIPWMIAGYWLLTRKEKKLPGLLLFTVALTLELRAGHPQITYYFFYLLGFLWVFDTWNSYKKQNLKSWSVVTGFLALGTILSIFGHAEKLLPLQEYASYSLRGGSALDNSTGLDSGYAFAWSQGIKETWTLLIPNYFGGASPEYWGPKSFTSGPHYLGALSLPFILFALFRQRSKIMYIFFVAGTLGMMFAWGENFRMLNQFAFDYIPYFDKFRAPETWLTLTAFCYTVVAVYGLDWFVDFVKDKKADLKKLYIPLGLSGAVLIFLFIQINSTNFTKPGEVENIANQIAQQNQVSPTNPQVQRRAESYVNAELVPEREEKAKSDLLRFAIILIISTGLMYIVFVQKIPLSIGLFGFILIAGFDLLSVDKRYIPENALVEGNVSSKDLLESQRRDIDTFIQDNISENTAYPFRVFPLLDNPYSSATPSYFYPNIGGYTAAKLSIIQDVLYNGGPLDVSSRDFNPDLLNLLNVKYLTYREGLPLPGFEPVFQSQSGVVYENQNVLSKAFFVDSVITVQDPPEAFNYLKPGQLDFATTAVVENSEPISSSPDTTASVEITNYTGPEISIDISREKPGFLVLSEIYYPAGWIAELNGEEIPIYKTNYLLRGMEIPAGEHDLELRFEPQSWKIGVLLSWISLFAQILIAGLWCFTWFKNRGSGDS